MALFLLIIWRTSLSLYPAGTCWGRMTHLLHEKTENLAFHFKRSPDQVTWRKGTSLIEWLEDSGQSRTYGRGLRDDLPRGVEVAVGN